MFIEHASTRKTVAKILKGYMVRSWPVVPDDVRLGTKMKIPNSNFLNLGILNLEPTEN